MLCAAGKAGKARVMMMLPGEPMLNGVPSSKMCTTLEEIEEALDEAERVHVRPYHRTAVV